MRVSILTKEIGHYHDARYTSAASAFYDMNVISVVGESYFKEFLATGNRAYPVHELYSGQSAYESAVSSGSIVPETDALLSRINPDVVVLPGWAGAESFAALLWARKMKRPVVMMSESQGFDAARAATREMVKRRIVRLCDAALVGGPTHRDYIEDLGMPADRVALGYDVVDNAHFAEGADKARAEDRATREKLRLPDRYILASARFIAKKNLPALVKAYGIARADAPGAPDLVILGDGEERPAIEAAIRDDGLSGHVHLPGFRGYDVLPAYYGLSEGFVHVSVVEQWGLVVNEAMASGVPVVVSRPCGVAAAVVEDGATGFVVDPTDIGNIAAGLRRLFAMTPGERQTMGAAARAAIADWGPERFASGLSSAVEVALAKPRKEWMWPWDAALLKRLSRRVIRDVM